MIEISVVVEVEVSECCLLPVLQSTQPLHSGWIVLDKHLIFFARAHQRVVPCGTIGIGLIPPYKVEVCSSGIVKMRQLTYLNRLATVVGG